jgi:hypothetical protein
VRIPVLLSGLCEGLNLPSRHSPPNLRYVEAKASALATKGTQSAGAAAKRIFRPDHEARRQILQSGKAINQPIGWACKEVGPDGAAAARLLLLVPADGRLPLTRVRLQQIQ